MLLPIMIVLTDWGHGDSLRFVSRASIFGEAFKDEITGSGNKLNLELNKAIGR